MFWGRWCEEGDGLWMVVFTGLSRGRKGIAWKGVDGVFAMVEMCIV